MTGGTKRNRMLLAGSCMLLISLMIYAGDNERKWALSYMVSPFVRPVLTSNLSDHSIGRGFKAFTILGEYYLPEKWAVEVGYFRTEVSYGDNSRTMEGIQLGMKKYFIKPDFFIQPYVAAATQLNWGRHIEKLHAMHGNYLNSQYTKNPVISLAPGVGAEIYLFSSIAFIARYNFNIGLNSKTTIDVRPETDNPYTLKDRGIYHNLELGIKITFPFRFSDDEQQALINGLKESLLY